MPTDSLVNVPSSILDPVAQGRSRKCDRRVVKFGVPSPVTGSHPSVLKTGISQYMNAESKVHATYAVNPGVPAGWTHARQNESTLRLSLHLPQPWLPPVVMSWKESANASE